MENEQEVEKTPLEIEGDGESTTPNEKELSSLEEDVQKEEESVEPTIPHKRVKEMVRKAQQKGKEEALKELLREDEEINVKKEEKSVPTGNERDEAIKLIRDAVRQEVGPLLARQEVEKFLENTPDALSYIDKIKKLRQENKELTWEQAYILASYNDKLDAASKGLQEKRKENIAFKQAAITEKPNAVPRPKKEGSIRERMLDRTIPLEQIEKELYEKLKSN